MATEEIIIKTDRAVREIDNLTNAVNDSTDASEQHGDTLLDTAANAKIFGVSINSLKSGMNGTVGAIKNSIKSLGAFKVALAATGIGLAVLALASFQAALKTSKRLADNFSDAGAAMSGIIDQMTADFGSFFTTIKEGEEDTNNFTSFLDKALFGLGQALPFLREYTTGLILVGNAAAESNKANREFTEGLAIQNLEVAKVSLAIEDLVNRTRRLGVTGSEQFDLVTEALGLFNDKVVATTAVLDTEERALRLRVAEQIAGSQELVDAEIKLTEFQIKRLNTERQLSAQQRELLNRQTEAFRKAALERTSSVDREIEQRGINLESAESAGIQLIDISDRLTETERENAQIRIDIAEREGRARLATINAVASAIAAGSQLAGKSSVFGKALAIASATASTIAAAANALKAVPFPLNFAASATVAAFGFGLISQIRDIVIPAPSFAKGGILRGPSHAMGGIKAGGVEFQGNEAVINTNSTRMFRKELSAMNVAGGGISFAHGGIVPSIPAGINIPNIQPQTPQFIPILYKDDLDKLNNAVLVTEQRATL